MSCPISRWEFILNRGLGLCFWLLGSPKLGAGQGPVLPLLRVRSGRGEKMDVEDTMWGSLALQGWQQTQSLPMARSVLKGSLSSGPSGN